MSTTLDDGNGFSISKIIDLRSEGFATIRQLSATIISISTATEALDVALTHYLATGLIDGQTSLVAAVQRLAVLIESEGQH